MNIVANLIASNSGIFETEEKFKIINSDVGVNKIESFVKEVEILLQNLLNQNK